MLKTCSIAAESVFDEPQICGSTVYIAPREPLINVNFTSRPDLHQFGLGAKNTVRVAQVVAALDRLGADVNDPYSFDEDENIYNLNVTDEVEVEGEVFDGMDDEDLLSLLAIPMPIELKPFSEEKVENLITEVLGIRLSVEDVYLNPGTDGAVLQIHQVFYPSADMCVHQPSKLHLLFYGFELCAMSVSDFGNFLYALKHHGEEVALATLRHIYSKTV